MRTTALLSAALLAALVLPARAAEDGAEARIASDRFVAGGSVRQAKPVDGDLFGVGGNVDVAAAVSGDAVLAGGDVRIREPIGFNLYAAGGNVRIESSVGRNARLAGGNVEVAAQGSIGGNLTVAGGTVEIRGPVAGHLRAAGGDVLIDSAVSGDVTTAGGGLELGPNARIAGKLVHRGPEKIRRDPAAQVAGGVEIGAPIRAERRGENRHGRGFMGWLWTLGLVVLAGVIAGAFPAASQRMASGLRADPGMGLLLGFIALVCVPVAAVILMITIIGIPIALVVLLLYFLMLIIGYAAVAVMIGDTALARLRSQDAARIGWRVGAAMLAMLALALLGRVPVLGGLVVFAALLGGLGAIALAVRAARAAAPSAAPAAA